MKEQPKMGVNRTGIQMSTLDTGEMTDGTATLPLEQRKQMRDDEARHFALVADVIGSLGGDPTAQTPGADVAGVEAMGLLHTINDARTTAVQSLQAILVAELTDKSGWELLIALAEQQNHDTMAGNFNRALERERIHLQRVRAWHEEAAPGSPLDHAQEDAGAMATRPLH